MKLRKSAPIARPAPRSAAHEPRRTTPFGSIRFTLNCDSQLCIAILGLWIIGQTASAQSILPPAPGSIGGGNPLQGLGRPDDPSPSRYQDFAQKNLQDTTNTGSASSSDLQNNNQGANPIENLDKLLSPDGLKSLTGTLEGAGADAASGTESGGLKSDSIEFTDKAGATFSDQSTNTETSGLESSQTLPRAGLYSNEKTDGSNSSTSADVGSEGLPPEPPGLATPLISPNLSSPLKTSSLSNPEENAETTKTPSRRSESKTPVVSERASTRGAIQKNDSAFGERGLSSRKAMTERIRQAVADHRPVPNTPKSTAKTEQAPQELQLVPAPPPMAVSMPPEGPTPERQALSLIKQGNYKLAEQQLRDLISTDPTNLHARYLFAVTLVFNKKYDEAKTNYGLIIRKAQDKKLVEMAESGLHKLTH